MRIRIAFAFIASLFAFAPGARAQTVEIKLGTLAPKGSTWETLLKEMGQKWAEASGGKVKLRIYPGGVMGNEGDMVRKMQVGVLGAAAITTIGLHDITPEPQALDAPMMVQSFDEMDYIMAKVQPQLDAALDKKGYVAITWSDVGFVRFFSTKPIRTMSDAAQAKVFAWDGDPKSVEAWKAAGFHPVVLSSTDVIPSLQTGMIDTVSSAPLYAFTSRIFQKANKMSDLDWALLNGATVVRKDLWDRVPSEIRPKLIQIANEYGKKIAADVRRMNDDAITQMKKQGLEEVHVTDRASFEQAAARANKVVRGGVVPAQIFDEVERLHREYQASHHH